MESSASYDSLNKNWKMMKQAGLIECPGDITVAGLPLLLVSCTHPAVHLYIHPPFKLHICGVLGLQVFCLV